MLKFKISCFVLISLCSSAIAGPKEDALQVVERWAKAFTEADVDTIIGLYASDAVFMGTGSKTIVAKPEDIKKYFQGALLGNKRFVVTFVESAVTAASETAFVVTALDRVALTEDGMTRDVFGRLTFVVVRRDSGWRIVSFHRSAMPS